MRKTMFDTGTGLFTDTVDGNHSAWHSQIFSMWAGVANDHTTWPGLIKFLQVQLFLSSVA